MDGLAAGLEEHRLTHSNSPALSIGQYLEEIEVVGFEPAPFVGLAMVVPHVVAEVPKVITERVRGLLKRSHANHLLVAL